MDAEFKENMVVENVDQLMALFGVRDENVELIRRELNVEIFAHGNEITLSGEEEKVRLARVVMERLVGIIARGESIDRTRIRYAIELASEGN
ncbi:MAG: hypothetical protein J5998_12635, partial [Clostridia bacterium]|nr:hypothetical protein [Clostridia bacterium]